MSVLDKYPVVIRQAIQWGDMDAFQHINNIVYFKYFENARIEYFQQTGINRYMKEHHVGPILGSTECKFLAPLTYPDEVLILTRVKAMKSKRFTMEYAIHSNSLRKPVAVGSGEIIFYHYLEQQSHKIPRAIVDNILHLEEKHQNLVLLTEPSEA